MPRHSNITFMLAPPDESPAPNNRYIYNKKQRADYRASCETMNLFKRKQRNSLLSTFIAVNSLTCSVTGKKDVYLHTPPNIIIPANFMISSKTSRSIECSEMIISSRNKSNSILHPMNNCIQRVPRGGGGLGNTNDATRSNNGPGTNQPPSQTTTIRKQKTLNTLHQTSFLIVASTSIVAFSPLPSLLRHLGNGSSISSSSSPQEQAVKILSVLSALSASIELFLSPIVGVWIDTFGRKQPASLLYGLITLANLGVVLYPSVASICVSRMVNVIISGFLMIVANAIIGDVFSSSSSSKDGYDTAGVPKVKEDDVHGKDQMGSTIGRQAAAVSLGFLFGSLVGGRLMELGERAPYALASIFSALAALNMAWKMNDSLQYSSGAARQCTHHWNWGLLRQKVRDAPLSSIQLLFHYGSHMRTLALLMLLQSAPMYMGDVFQVFARDEWGLLPKDFGGLIALFGILGILSNLSLSPVLKILGIRKFTLFAILSSLLSPTAVVLFSTYTPFLIAACFGFYSSAQKVGTSAAMTSLAYDLGIPQGELAGQKASMSALLKIICPVLYSWLYLKGKSMSLDVREVSSDSTPFLGIATALGKVGGKMPFLLNVLLGVVAFGVTWKNI
mmetsp:Transcript_8840/g.18864  ORF Transcript_8840/g.18864 Transcript_8840/m.18864 type:complete len:618 (-) Transcript_8840:250-2103(-)